LFVGLDICRDMIDYSTVFLKERKPHQAWIVLVQFLLSQVRVEFGMLVFQEEVTLNDPGKNPWDNAKTNIKLNSHMAQGQNK